MSILDNTNQPVTPDPSEMIATHCKIHARQTFSMMVKAYDHGIKTFWKSSIDPQLISDKLGTDAKEIFELHYKLGQFINSIKPDTISFADIGQFTINDNGTVTIVNSSN